MCMVCLKTRPPRRVLGKRVVGTPEKDKGKLRDFVAVAAENGTNSGDLGSGCLIAGRFGRSVDDAAHLRLPACGTAVGAVVVGVTPDAAMRVRLWPGARQSRVWLEDLPQTGVPRTACGFRA